MSKKPTKRSETEYPSLNPEVNLKTRKDLIDFDYINTLPEEWVDPKTGKKYNPKQWLNDFTEEYVGASFKKKRRIHKKVKIESPQNKDVAFIKKEFIDMIYNIRDLINSSSISIKSQIKLKKNLTKFKLSFNSVLKKSLRNIDDSYKKDSETRNNARNNCVMTLAKAQGKILELNELPLDYGMDSNIEDDMIDRIDAKRESADE